MGSVSASRSAVTGRDVAARVVSGRELLVPVFDVICSLCGATEAAVAGLGTPREPLVGLADFGFGGPARGGAGLYRAVEARNCGFCL